MNFWNCLFTVGSCCSDSGMVSHSFFDHMMVIALLFVFIFVLPLSLMHLLNALIQRYIYPGKQSPDQEAK